MKLLVLVLLAAMLSAFGATPAGTTARSTPDDLQLIQAASSRLSHQPPTQVIAWLRRQSAVAQVRTGGDGRTIDVSFRDGRDLLILANRLSTTRLHFEGQLTLQPHQTYAGARAAVWEPFAAELGLGSQAGNIEASDLQQAGFQVSQAYDQSVTVALMGSLSSYNVVYMHTHSGLSGSGQGVVATGQLASSMVGLPSDGSVTVVGVAGSTQTYYAITARFIASHLSPFPQHSLIFLNGCALLPATDIWQALLGQGAGAMLSWSGDATTYDDYLSAAAFFNVMATGKSVAAALQALSGSGYGKSSYAGQTALLGLRGDGSITLAMAASGQPYPPPATVVPTRKPAPTATVTASATPVLPTSTPTATATSTASPTPTETATATEVPPPSLSISRLRSSVAPGKRQTIEVQTDPGTSVSFRVTFPDGQQLSTTRIADGTGSASFTFQQPSNSITRHDARALISIEAGSGSVATLTDGYTIGYGAIDLSVQPRQPLPGSALIISVHTAKRTVVIVHVNGHARMFQSKTGAVGWIGFRYHIPAGAPAGRRYSITARATLHARTHRTKTVVTVA